VSIGTPRRAAATAWTADIVSSKPKDKDVGTQNKLAASGDHPPKQPRGVDRWFDEEINKLYVDVVNEPLPDDLARLVNELKARKAT
jgi:hypothetical protein